MDQSLACPHCGQIFLNQPELAGQVVQCTTCSGQFQLPLIAVFVPNPTSEASRGVAPPAKDKSRSSLWVIAFLLGAGMIGSLFLPKPPIRDPEADQRAKEERDERKKQQTIDREKSRQHEQEMADTFSGKNSRSQAPTMRFGLTEAQRREYFRELVLLEDRLGIHTSKAMAAKEALRRRYNISKEQSTEIFVESHEENWPLPPME